jgi:hypothetical protein
MDVKTLLRRYELARIELTLTTEGVYARAIPIPYGRVVQARREAALQAAAVAQGREDFSLSQVSKITEDTAKAPVATARGKDLDSALEALAAELKLSVNHAR